MRVCGACRSRNCSEEWVCGDCGSKPAVIDGFNAFARSLASDSPGFREEFFADLAAIESGNFWFRGRNNLITWAISKYFPDLRRFLEIGCGTGFALRGIQAAFPSAELSGSEIFVEGLRFARRRVPLARLYQMDARSIPFRDHFDVIGAFDVLEHIVEDETVLDEVHRALRPGGGLVVTVPQHPALWSSQDELSHHVRRYTAAGLRRKVTAAGFQLLRTTSFVSLLLPMMFASRLWMRETTPDGRVDAVDVLRLPGGVNVALEGVMRIEAALVRGGVSFPAGGSLLLVARKPGRAADAT